MLQLMNIRDIESVLDKYGELIIQKKNKNNVIVMSVDEYKKKIISEELEKNLSEAENDIENGRTIDAELIIEEWKTKYGI